jgi:hypothetical protein
MYAEKLTETVLHLNLGHFVRVFLLCVVFFCFFPLWWDNNRTTSETPSPGLEAEGRTPKWLRLKLSCIWTWRFSFHLFIFFMFYFQSSLCLSNACSAYCWLVHYHSLFMSLKLFSLFICFVFSTCFFLCFYLFLQLLCFPSSLTLPF